ncbi:MAG: AAA family ATPase, partial [Ardenticatenaceae bacterium]
MRLNPYITSHPIDKPANFFGRADILHNVTQLLQHKEHNTIVLYGQRCIGKTSLLLQLEEQLGGGGVFSPVYFDLMGKAEISLGDLLYQLAQEIASVVGQNLPPREEFDAEGIYFCQTFLPHAASAAAEGGLVLLFDEFDVLDRPQAKPASETFFPYLRRWMADFERVQLVFVMGRQPQAFLLNRRSIFKGVPAIPLSLFSRKEAANIVRQAQQNESLSWLVAAVNQVWRWTEGHPYFTQVLCRVVWQNAYQNKPKEVPYVLPEHVDAAVGQLLGEDPAPTPSPSPNTRGGESSRSLSPPEGGGKGLEAD